MGPTWVPLGSCRPQMAMLVPWTLLSGVHRVFSCSDPSMLCLYYVGVFCTHFSHQRLLFVQAFCTSFALWTPLYALSWTIVKSALSAQAVRAHCHKVFVRAHYHEVWPKQLNLLWHCGALDLIFIAPGQGLMSSNGSLVITWTHADKETGPGNAC